MEKVPDIIREIREKKGRIWLGLMPATENQLNELMLYLGHQTLQEDPKKIQELVDLYYTAKESEWRKMEGIKRKLDQLSITLGKPDDVQILTMIRKMDKEAQARPIIDNYPRAIKNLKQRIEDLLKTTLGKSLPELTNESIINFLHYLNHEDLPKRYKQLFDEMLEKYNAAEEVEFTKMQSFNDTLIKVEIKLGTVTEDMKTWKSPKEIEQELEERKGSLDEKKEEFENEKLKLRKEWAKLLEEQEKFKKEKEEFDREKVMLESAQMILESEKEKLEKLRKELEAKQTLLEKVPEAKINGLNGLTPPK